MEFIFLFLTTKYIHFLCILMRTNRPPGPLTIGSSVYYFCNSPKSDTWAPERQATCKLETHAINQTSKMEDPRKNDR